MDPPRGLGESSCTGALLRDEDEAGTFLHDEDEIETTDEGLAQYQQFKQKELEKLQFSAANNEFLESQLETINAAEPVKQTVEKTMASYEQLHEVYGYWDLVLQVLEDVQVDFSTLVGGNRWDFQAAGVTSLLCVEERILKEVISGNLCTAVRADASLNEVLRKHWRVAEKVPTIYIRCLVDQSGNSPTPKELRQVIQALHFYLSDTKEAGNVAHFIDHKFFLNSEQSRSRRGFRYYLGHDEKAGEPWQDRRDRREKTLAFCQGLTERLDELGEEQADRPLKSPLSYVGYAHKACERNEAHDKHRSSSFLMGLVESVVAHLFPGQYQVEMKVIALCWEPVHGKLAEILWTALAHSSHVNGGGFSIAPAGQNNPDPFRKSSALEKANKWTGLSMIIQSEFIDTINRNSETNIEKHKRLSEQWVADVEGFKAAHDERLEKDLIEQDIRHLEDMHGKLMRGELDLHEMAPEEDEKLFVEARTLNALLEDRAYKADREAEVSRQMMVNLKQARVDVAFGRFPQGLFRVEADGTRVELTEPSSGVEVPVSSGTVRRSASSDPEEGRESESVVEETPRGADEEKTASQSAVEDRSTDSGEWETTSAEVETPTDSADWETTSAEEET